MELALQQDLRDNPDAWARDLGVSKEAVEIYMAADVIDLHIDAFIWTRVFGYDLRQRHTLGPLGGRWFSQIDMPRALEGGLTGGVWSITTNPLRSARGRREVFFENLATLKQTFAQQPEGFALARTAAEYRQAQAEGKHAVFFGIQGGNALDYDLDDFDKLDGDIVRVTVMGFTHSSLGASSETIPAWLPRPPDEGLTSHGRDFVRKLDEQRIFVDLSHATRQAFHDAIVVHDPSLPLMVSHAGVAAVHDCARNLTDTQLRAVADTGGVVGIIFKPQLMGSGTITSHTVMDHIAYAVGLIGEDCVCLGADWDGVMVPPKDMPTPSGLPRLVQRMLDRGWRPESILKILGGSFLRALTMMRG